MACDQWRGKIDAYVDTTLNTAETHSFESHLHACPSCTADALRRLQWKRAVSSAGKRYTPSAEFRERIAQQVAPRQRATWLGAWLPRFAMAAIVLIAVGFFTQRWLSSRQEKTFGELADVHVATLASAAPVDVISTDRHTVKPWFAGKLPFTFNLPELANTPFTLIGGRVVYLDQTAGAQLLFQVRQHKISVFIFQDRGGLWRPSLTSGKVTHQVSFNASSWSESGLRYFIISDVSPGDIQQLSELLRASAKS